MGDQLDYELVVQQTVDFSAGQWSNPHPTDQVVMPPNACTELLDAEIDVPGKVRKRKGWSLIADDLGSNRINGLIGYYPSGGTKFLVMECNGIIYTWNGSDGSWTSRQTGLTPQSQVYFFVGVDGIYRVSQENTIRQSVNGSSWVALADSNSYFPRAKFAILSASRRALAFNTSANPNFGYYSDAGAHDATDWDRTTNAFAFGKDTEEGITGAIEFTNGEIVVFNPDEMFIWSIADPTPSNWTQFKVADIGCVAIGSVKQVGEDALFLSRDGVRSVAQSAQDKKRGASIPLSWPINDWVERINWAQAAKAQATVWADKYILAVPLDSATENSHAFVWSRRAYEANGRKGGWTIHTNTTANCFGVQSFSSVPRLYFGESAADGKVYVYRNVDPADDDTSDNGTAITLSVELPRLTHDAPHLDKTYSTVEVEALAQTAGTIDLDSQINGGGYTDVGTFSQSSGLLTLPFDLPATLVATNIVRKKFDLESLGRGRNIQNKILESTLDADCELLNVITAAWPEQYELNE